MPGKVHLLFAADQAWRSTQADLLPPCAPPPASCASLSDLFQPAAEEGVAGLVVFGWRRGLFEVISSDARLRQKRLIVILQREFLGDLENAVTCCDLDVVSAILLSGDASLPTIMQHLPMVWSFAIIDPEIASLHDLHHLIGNRFIRRSASVERMVRDLENLRARIGRIPDSIPLSTWRDAYQGRTALCIAAGPSLDRRMDFLRAHASHAVVIAVDVIASRLQAAGIPIDFVINVDSGDGGAEFFRPSTDAATTLIMPLNGHLNHDQRFHRVSYFGLGSLHQQFLGSESSFSHGTTVGVASVGFAQFVGCREIVLLGHDLAYEDGAYYSSLAGPDDGFATREESSQKTTRVETPGNGGRPVATNQLFRIAIDDFGLLLRFGPVSAVYNPNVNDGIGALIPQTHALPTGWSPELTSEKNRPDSDRRVTIPPDAPTGQDLVAWLSTDAQRLLTCWKEFPAHGHSLASAQIEFELGKRDFPSESLINFTFEAFIFHQLRLFRTPHIGNDHPAIVASTRAGLQAMEDAVNVFCELNAPRTKSLPDPQLAAFLARSWRVEHGANDVTDDFYRSLEAVLLSRLWTFAPHAEGPDPLSAEDGLAFLALLPSTAPRSLALATLAWCRLTSATAFAAPLAAAREAGLLTAWDLTREAPPRDGRLGAVEAFLRIEAGCAAPGDIARCASWYPCHHPLIANLLSNDLMAAERAIRERLVHLDDMLAAMLVHRHPELTRATALLEGRQSQIGEATTLALAGRLLESGKPADADRLAASIRPLSRFADQARAVRCECALQAGDPRGALSISETFRVPDLALPYVVRAAVQTQNWTLVEQSLTDQSPVELLATALGPAWKARHRPTIARIAAIVGPRQGESPEIDQVANASIRLMQAFASGS